MRRFNVFHAFILSFFMPGFYRDVGQNWRGIGFAYLFLLLFLAWIPTTIHTYTQVQAFAKDKLPDIVAELPQIVISDGVLSIDRESPYIVKDPDNPEEIIAVIDTSGKYTDLNQVETNILVLKTKAIVRDRDSGKVNEFVYKDHEEFRNIELTHATLMKWLDEYRDSTLAIVFIIGFFVAFLASYCYRLLQSLVYALFGMIFASIIGNVEKDFGFLLRLTCIAMTPAIIIATILGFTDISFPLLGYFGISMAYLFFALYANKDADFGALEVEEENE